MTSFPILRWNRRLPWKDLWKDVRMMIRNFSTVSRTGRMPFSPPPDKNQVLLVQVGSKSQCLQWKIFVTHLFCSAASALKDVMRMIATRKNIRLEDGEVDSAAVAGGGEEQRPSGSAIGSKTSRSRGLGM